MSTIPEDPDLALQQRLEAKGSELELRRAVGEGAYSDLKTLSKLNIWPILPQETRESIINRVVEKHHKRRQSK